MEFIGTAESVDQRYAQINQVARDQHNIHIYGGEKMPDLMNRIQGNNSLTYVTEGHPPHAPFAAFDSNGDRTRCLKGTRTDILDQVFRWVGIKNDAPRDPQEKCIFWINGSAGTGKTTISYTVAEECRKFDILGASFFCSHDDSECSNPRRIFTTIAYQLGKFSPLFQAEVSRVMMSKPDIGDADVLYQLEQLIINPLRSLAGSIRPSVIVVDALDECEDKKTPSIILSALSRYVAELSPLKFLVTSRPEHHITTGFRDKELIPITHRLILHEVQLDVVQGDIMSYLSSKLALTRDAYNIQREWPAIEDIGKLAQLSHGLFIFAATSVKFIEDPNYSDPQGQLTDLLNPHSEGDDESPHFHLYQLYTQVFDRAFPNISSRLSERLKKIVGSIILIREPLSPFALARLLELEPSTVQATLARLHSVIIVPEDDTRTIRLLHPSFFDFITNPLRCQNPKFVVNPEMQHTFLAYACLQAMKGLRQDLCEIKNPSILNSEVDDLTARINASILPHMQYACRHWASHLAQATSPDNLVNLVKEFCAVKLLNWLEVCSLLGELRSAVHSLNTAQRTVVKPSWDVPDALHLLRDCERFTLEFFPAISSSSLQVYRSALLFAPKKSAIRKAYGGWLDQALTIHNAPDETWNPCIRVMDGHTFCVNSVAISPDGTRIVSGSQDGTLRLWDAVSGAHLLTLTGYSYPVHSVSFSPDGTRILSGSDDKTLRLWGAAGGVHLVTLTGHTSSIRSVAFSPDSFRIVSGSDDKTLRLWDAVSGGHLVTLTGHSHSVQSVAFSSNSTRIVSGSADKSLRLWDAANGAHLVTLRGHSSGVTSVAFSPDGTRIASGSDDKTIRVWDAVSGAHALTLTGHSFSVYSIAFSPYYNRLVSGSSDNTLRLWDIVSGAHLATLTGHSRSVRSVAFSPDGIHIVSGSRDKSIRLWDAVSSVHLITPSERSNRVISLAFSPDGNRIVSGSDDSSLQLWDAVSGVHLVTLTGHRDRVCSVAFSPDGSGIVSGSRNGTFRLWDAVTGTHVITRRGYVSSIRAVAFSRDGTCIASGSGDCTLRLWDAISGALLGTLTGHSLEVTSVAFSPDGARIASGSGDCTLRLWDIISGACLGTLTGHSSSVDSIAFSPDGTRIVSGSDDQTLWLWDAVNGVPLDKMQGLRIYVSSLARSLSSSWTSFSKRNASPSGPSSPIFTYLTEDGWIYSAPLNRRICWIPPSFRPLTLDVTQDSVAFGTDGGRVVVLHFKNVDLFLSDCQP